MSTCKLILGLIVGLGLSTAGLVLEGPRMLDAREQSLVRGAVNNKCCNPVQTCDQRNFGLPCNQQGTGSICLNCIPDTETDDLCVSNTGDNCETSLVDVPCGEKWVGNCAGAVCDGSVMFLGEDCAVDARQCSGDSC